MNASNDNGKTFERILEQYEKAVFNIAFRMINDYEDAMDITQATFVKVFEKFDTYDPSRKIFNWISKIAFNDCINYINRKKRSVRLEGDVAVSGDPAETTYQSEISARLQRALMELNVDYRSVLILRHFNDLSYSEISDVLAIPVKTVKSRLFTGRRLLRDALLKQGYVG
jgi:RNA polymerase sigma-70 factor (ECF subfamily)